MIGSGFYHAVRLTPDGPDGTWTMRLFDMLILDREQAIELVNRDRATAAPGALYRLIELSTEELDEILQDYEDDDDYEY